MNVDDGDGGELFHVLYGWLTVHKIPERLPARQIGPVSLISWLVNVPGVEFIRGVRLAMLDRFFRLSENATTVRTEVVAGVTTFVTMAYIIFVQPMVLSGEIFGKPTGMDFHSVTAATCISAALGYWNSNRYLLVANFRKRYD